MKRKTKKRQTVKKPKDFDFAPVEEIEKTLNYLNSTEIVKSRNRNMCQSVKKKRFKDSSHLASIHYCSLIRYAILNHNWKDVLKILLAYIDEPRPEKFTSGVIFKYTLIYLLNDPVARQLNIMEEFLQLALSCQTQEQRNELLNAVTSLS